MLRAILAAGLVAASVSAAFGAEPGFKDFPAGDIYSGRHAKPVFSSKETSAYKARFNSAARKPPNFGGHYVIDEWGCGSGCKMGGIVELKTGKTFILPTVSTEAGDFEKGQVGEYAYSKDSNLLIAKGHLNDDGPYGVFYFQMTPNGLQQIGQ
ncbi:hypothetical protein [Labrys neptuniae]